MGSCCCHKNCVSHNLAAFIGRILIGVLFVFAALSKLADWQGSVDFVGTLGLPYPALLLGVGVVIEFFGGLGLIFGYKTRLSAWLLLLLLIVVTVLFHNVWEAGKEDQWQPFLFNLAFIGSTLLLIAFGPGKYSVDAAKRHHVCCTKEHDCCKNKEEHKE